MAMCQCSTLIKLAKNWASEVQNLLALEQTLTGRQVLNDVYCKATVQLSQSYHEVT